MGLYKVMMLHGAHKDRKQALAGAIDHALAPFGCFVLYVREARSGGADRPPLAMTSRTPLRILLTGQQLQKARREQLAAYADNFRESIAAARAGAEEGAMHSLLDGGFTG